MGKAIELIYQNIDQNNAKLTDLREYYLQKLKERFSDVYLNGHRFDRLPGNANVSFKGIDAGELLLYLDANGICASAGSACTSGSLEPSHVLLAIGLNEELATGTLRATFGVNNTKDDIDFFIDCIESYIKNHKINNYKK